MFLMTTLAGAGASLFVWGLMFLGGVPSQSVVLELGILYWGGVDLPLVLIWDRLSSLFAISVSLISFSVFIFSVSYMHGVFHTKYFHLMLSMFVGSMMVLIFSPGMVSLIIGWDGLGLTSFLLVVFYSNPKSLSAGLITVLTNRLGDGFVLVSMFLGVLAISFNYESVAPSPPEGGTLVWVLFLILGASTKSAQVPFMAWLPAAMAAPTPVSALVHSSTLVTAGVYVLIRASGLVTQLGGYLGSLGAVTLLVAGISALGEMDMKKIVALSTLSQLGVMFMALGANSPELSFFHLISHAFFKALMFISVGNIILSSVSYQHLGQQGGMGPLLPVSSCCLVASKASLCGLPFFSGFFSKEGILESMGGPLQLVSLPSYLIMVLGLGLTLMYSLRFIFLVFYKLRARGVVGGSAETSTYSLGAIMCLLLPGVGGGLSLHALAVPGAGFQVSPEIVKALIVLSGPALLVVSLWNLFFPFIFGGDPEGRGSLWLTPLFSGQLVLGSLGYGVCNWESRFWGGMFSGAMLWGLPVLPPGLAWGYGSTHFSLWRASSVVGVAIALLIL